MKLEKRYIIGKDSALLIIDVQNDFCPNGALPVPDGDKIIPILNKYIEKFVKAGASIYATRDWHPPNHISFKTRGGTWPPHCIQNTRGAEFHPKLALPKGVKIISKGTSPDREAYSGFEGTNLSSLLKDQGIKTVFIGGLATDYCVKATVLDALKEGFHVVFLEDASKGVDVNKGDSERAIKIMMEKGAEKATLSQIFTQ
ncbi:MAG: bifunctional nicotinamidase/pyrazinamidase [Nitrososphaerales archaeon]